MIQYINTDGRIYLVTFGCTTTKFVCNNVTHLKVIEAFKKSKEEGTNFCNKRGYKVFINDGILQVKSSALFGFQMNAIIKEV